MSIPEPAYRSEGAEEVPRDDEHRPVTTRDKFLGVFLGASLAGLVIGLSFWLLR